MSVGLFRALLVLSVLLAVCGAVLDGVFPAWLPGPLQAAQQALECCASPASEWGDGAVLAVTGAALALFLAGCVGLYLLRPWARALALVATLAALPLAWWLGPTVLSGPATVLNELSLMLWGAVLAQACWGPLSAWFRRG